MSFMSVMTENSAPPNNDTYFIKCCHFGISISISDYSNVFSNI